MGVRDCGWEVEGNLDHRGNEKGMHESRQVVPMNKSSIKKNETRLHRVKKKYNSQHYTYQRAVNTTLDAQS